MASFKINDANKAAYINDATLLLNQEFVNSLNLEAGDEIFIEQLLDDSITCIIIEADFSNFKLTFHTCKFKEFWVSDCKFDLFILYNLTLGDKPADGPTKYLFVMEKTTANTFWVFNSSFYQGLLIRNRTSVKSARINETTIYYNLSFANSQSETLEVESSTIEFINITDIPSSTDLERPPLEIDTINIFRTAILKGISIYQSKFTTLHIHGIRFLRTDKLKKFQNQISVTTAATVKNLKSVRITESELQAAVIISFNHAEEFVCYANQFESLRVNFWEITTFSLADCKFSGPVYWGFPQHLKTIGTYDLTNCEFGSEYYFSDTIITGICKFYGCSFLKYPSFFTNIRFGSDCAFDFSFSRLTNLIFDTIRFHQVTFTTLDASHPEFRNCHWDEEKGRFATRYLVRDEKLLTGDLQEWIKVKDIYAKLASNFYQNSDFISYGRFQISEQETKRQIALKSKSRIEYMTLTLHKLLSSYGENFSQPLLIMVILWLMLTVVFLFTGFYAGDHLVKYELSLDLKETGHTMLSLLQSAVFSLKNLVPFPMSAGFFVYSDKTQALTQTLELLQKLLNVVLFASFTAALLRYIKK